MNAATARRTRYLVQSAVLMLAVSAACVFGVIVASRFPLRLDATASREHQLSERSRRLLASLDRPHEVVLVLDASASDARGVENAVDVLDMLDRESPQVSSTIIDSGSGRGAEQLDAVFARLVSRFDPTIRAAANALEVATSTAAQLATDVTGLVPALQSAAEAVDPTAANAAELRRFFADSAAVLRVGSEELDRASQSAKQTASQFVKGTRVPTHDRAVAELRGPVNNLLKQFEEIRSGLDALVQAKTGVISETTRSASRSIQTTASPIRDQLATLAISLEQIPLSPLERCLRTLSAGPAALVIGPPATTGEAESHASATGLNGVTAVDIHSLLRPASSDDPTRGRLDLRFRVEELIVGGLAVLNTRDAPIICFTHGAGPNETLSPEFVPMRALLQRLSLRGIDAVEWPAAVLAEPPSLSSIAGSATRPVVYVVIPTNALTPDGAIRSKKLAERVAQLVREGRPVLLSLNPSTLPGIGQRDPMVEFLEPLGLKADTGRPILQSLRSDSGARSGQSVVVPDVVLVRSDSSTPIGEAIQSLRTHLRWSIPLRIDPAAQQRSASHIRTVLSVPASETFWAESEWLGFWQIAAADRGRVSNPPTPNQVRDDVNGPWTVVAAIDRSTPSGQSAGGAAGEGGTTAQPASTANTTNERDRAGRMVVVGANGWFFDEFTQVADVVDGRAVPRVPGNTELFESAVYWLAGQDELIARSAEAQAAPIIRADLSERSLTLVRWVLIAGLPVLILLAGALWRLLRG